MDFKEEGRYGARAGPYHSQYSGHDGTNDDEIVSYPKLRQLLDLKTKMIESRHHPAMLVRTKCLKQTNMMQFDKFDVIVMKLPLAVQGGEAAFGLEVAPPKKVWSMDDFQNSLRMDLLAESPSFILVGCGSTIQGLQTGRRLLKEWGFRRAEDIIWVKKSKPNDAAFAGPQKVENSVFAL